MNTVIWILLLAGLAVTTAILTANGGAFVLIVLPPWRIELSVAAFVIAVLLMMVLGFFVTRVTAGTLSLPSSIRALRLGRRQAKAKEAVLFAVEAFFEGNYARAEQAAQRALTQGESVGLCAGHRSASRTSSETFH
jgi:HemY protein